MALYESDSSDEDDRSYTETGVLLGYASTDPTVDPISHLGGHPVRSMIHSDYLELTPPCSHGWTQRRLLQESLRSARSVRAS